MTGQIHIQVAVNSTDSRIARQAESFRCFRYLLFYIGMSISRIVFLLVPEFVIDMKAYIFVLPRTRESPIQGHRSGDEWSVK